MKTIREIPNQIDTNDDGVKLELNLFSQGEYDCDEFRSVVRNVGVRLGVTNNLNRHLIIENIYPRITTNEEQNFCYYSSSLFLKFPVELEPNGKFCANFYGTSLKTKFAFHKKEKAVFALGIKNGKNPILSDEFSGDQVEEFITTLEDGDYPNWGSKDFHSFDKKIDAIVNGNLSKL
ncbi:hypothetical protein [Maribacter halichondriae]|uniref:hypothetical protein n=1 Tax=Maribacter halichondriae TaxID=2980554 RepID=UPI00235A075E|nr:hypothetical protein [Maribacter sp. Hal144]